MNEPLIFGMIAGVLIYWGIWWQIFDKAKYRVPAFMGVLMCVPFVNFVLLIFFVFSTWPVEREVEKLKKTSIVSDPQNLSGPGNEKEKS